ncbi:MAG TPA: cytochrome c biogenesis protein CcdA [Bryobacteraceae bacterium]|nr:cytochrome c biogenesis protein CcdA [Bryobacteraceae bacterium]
MFRFLVLTAVVSSLLPAQSKRPDPVKWKLEFSPGEAKPGGLAIAKLTATIEEGWHLYSPTTPKGGPIITKIGMAENPLIEKGEVHRPQPIRKMDPNFQIETETYEQQALFFLKLRLNKTAPEGPGELAARMRYSVCTDKECLPPVNRTAAATLTITANAPSASFVLPEGYALVGESPAAASAKPAGAAGTVPQGGGDMGRFALVAFGLGLAAIFTPCVFPMIPFTMTYFLNRKSGSRADSIFQAGVFSGGIILLFTSLGLLTTAVMGASGVVQLGSNPWVNAFIAVIFIAFSLSLLGAFEITLPSSLLTKMDQASQSRGGVLGSLLMGLTFSLTSFACVGPFMGSLLAASVQGDKLQPAIGMAAFAAGLASPFFFLALFPATLSRMPKSGGWLPRVKIVLGFVLLAVSFKYLSNIDQVLQWNVLTRERFLAVWVVLFALPGLYLLGLLRMEGIKPDQNAGVSRTLLGAAFLALAISLIPGMFGAKLGELDAYVPLSQEGFSANGGGGEKLTWMKNRYKDALARAKAENKLVFVNFTGYACTNCHWMKANMFPRPEVAAELKKFVLLELYTDGTDADSEKNQELQNGKFSTVAIPFYVLLDGEEKVIATSGMERSPEKFLAFLRTS